MTVEELIAKLQELDPKMEVEVPIGCSSCYPGYTSLESVRVMRWESRYKDIDGYDLVALN